ncbi:hypothetical protein ABG840_20755 [Phocaeicola vulgatus]
MLKYSYLCAEFKSKQIWKVLIRRKNEIYALVKVGREDLMITPELQARIDKAREEIKSGKCVTLKSSEDIDAYFDSL